MAISDMLTDALEEITVENEINNVIRGCIICRGLYELTNMTKELIDYLKTNDDIDIEVMFKSHLDFQVKFLYKGNKLCILYIKRPSMFVNERGSLYHFVFMPEDINDYKNITFEAMIKMRYANKKRIIYYK